MYLKAVSLLLALSHTVIAQTATVSPTSTATSASGSTLATSLPGLINQLPQCALPCLETGAESISCSVTDLTCLCSNTQSLISSVATCIFTSSCSSDDISKASEIAPQICSDVNSNADASEIASASNLIAQALSTTAASSTTSGSAAVRTDVPVRIMGAAAAIVALAL